jgi:phosphatidylinositol glycan class V
VYGGAGRQRPWCTNALPSAYGYVQDAYWNVGFLRYYEWCQVRGLWLVGWFCWHAAAAVEHSTAVCVLHTTQIPNFLLAAPTLIVSLWGAAAYARACWHHVLTGGLLPAAQLQRWFSCCSSLSEQAGRWPALVVVGRERYCSGSSTPGGGATAAAAKKIPGVAYQQLRLRQREVSAGQQAAGQPPPPQQQQQSLKPACASSCGCASHRAFYGPGCAVLVVHWAALTLVCLAVVHIQVATRFLSSCAPLYWFGGLLMLAAPPALRCLLWWYCFAFMAMGAVMFPNFLPWT